MNEDWNLRDCYNEIFHLIMKKNRVYCFINNYYPSFKSGGPVRSLVNLYDNLSSEIKFKFITSDRDAGDKERFEFIENYKKNYDIGKGETLFLPEMLFDYIFTIFRVLKEISSKDFVYFNSLFNFRYTIVPLILLKLFGKNKQPKIILSPRGELMPGALKISKNKKFFYLLFFRVFLIRNIKFHATSSEEQENISNILNRESNLISNLPASTNLSKTTVKKNDGLNLVYVSRITEKKNLDFFIRSLKHIDDDIKIRLDIFGPANGKDLAYLNKCVALSRELKKNITINFHKPIPNSKVFSTLINYDFSVLPTKGENFGHTIVEALLCGLPVVISKHTPFSDIEKENSGFILDIEDENSFVKLLPKMKSFKQNPKIIKEYVARKINLPKSISKYHKLFS